MNEKAKSVLQGVKYATLATVNERGEPWNSPVFCAYDESFNVYWSSTPAAEHSQNIIRTGQVFIVVYNSASDAGEGVYMQCAAEALEDEQSVREALKLLGDRRGEPFKKVEKFLPPGPQRIFKATPLHMWMNDADQDEDGDYIRDYRKPVAPVEK